MCFKFDADDMASASRSFPDDETVEKTLTTGAPKPKM
jgi:hypothetical protein